MQSDKELLKHKDHILQHTTDGEEGFNKYLNTRHINIITDNSISLFVISDDCIFIYYMGAYNKQGFRECSGVSLKLYEDYTAKQGIPVFYTGKRNVCKNNSKKIGSNLWQFIPKECQIESV